MHVHRVIHLRYLVVPQKAGPGRPEIRLNGWLWFPKEKCETRQVPGCRLLLVLVVVLLLSGGILIVRVIFHVSRRVGAGKWKVITAKEIRFFAIPRLISGRRRDAGR